MFILLVVIGWTTWWHTHGQDSAHSTANEDWPAELCHDDSHENDECKLPPCGVHDDYHDYDKHLSRMHTVTRRCNQNVRKSHLTSQQDVRTTT